MNKEKKAVDHEAELEELEQQVEVEEETTEADSPPEEENSPSEEEEVTEESEEDSEESVVEELTEEEVSKLSEKTQKRIRKLASEVERLKGMGERSPYQELEGMGKELPEPDIDIDLGVRRSNLPWDIDRTPEVTEEDYKKHVAEASRRVVQEELRHERILANVAGDIKAVEGKYPELNPDDKDNYDPELAGYLLREYRAKFRANPETRLLTHVESFMSYRKSGREEEKKAAQAKVAKQAAEQAITPTVSPARKTPSAKDLLNRAKTIEELDEIASKL